jgi:hemerythrin-like domain-containing protein
LTGLLLECHQRIRSFSALAVTIGERLDLSPGDLRESCERCRRYFAEALPLHIADEEQSLLPRLRRAEPALELALNAMQVEHGEHAALLAQLLAELDRVGAAPEDGAARQRLAQVASRLAAELEHHLAQEESLIFPRISALLTVEEQELIVAELRARRGSPRAP